ncbi:DUF3429 domain-containing protein [Mesorhizobium sp. LHD-90]|uniref:DUF3429 domain-containing protein n=1 Tax=Mesorhizobium sp. LHD-90 TaxID=3071414 RepID=UPI0027E0BCDD|nr:DUF3429 domain-containing protein [Mesorhizobium sp. LHD-90]MDQ6437403.1 DUF3429 domain-containing protein [Mesorhizobium sp. LHD-90]
MEQPAAEADGPFQAAGRIAGYLGLTPFIVLALWLYGIAPDHPWRGGTVLLLSVYGAVVLSFLGGVRWGAALSPERPARPSELWLTLPPAFVGWIAVAMPVPLSFAVLAVAFAALGAWDALAAYDNRLPEWYGRLRMILTLGAVATLLLAFAATS